MRLSHLAELLQPQEEQAMLLFCPRLACVCTTKIAETALHYSRTPCACCSAQSKRQPPRGTSSTTTDFRHETPAQGPAAETQGLGSACPRGSFAMATWAGTTVLQGAVSAQALWPTLSRRAPLLCMGRLSPRGPAARWHHIVQRQARGQHKAWRQLHYYAQDLF